MTNGYIRMVSFDRQRKVLEMYRRQHHIFCGTLGIWSRGLKMEGLAMLIPEQSCWAFTTVIVASLGTETLDQPAMDSTF